MPTSNNPQRPLAELLAELEIAVRAGNRLRAVQLEQIILQRLATEAADHAATERRVRALMEQLKLASATPPGPPAAPSPHVRGVDPSITERGEAAVADGVVYPVWFGTNRKPAAGGTGFTGERHDRITRGRVEVHVPEAHRFGETGNSFWKRLLRFDLRDDHLRAQKITRQERDAFFADIQKTLQAAREGGETPHALFFLHGFNVTFESAAIRAAQIGVDLKSPATAFFSWPSRGNVAAYPADEASIEASERAITDFLVEFTANCGAEKIHVIAHSMGNRGLLRALQRIAANAQTRGKVRFGQVFLAAPDVDRDLFLDLARLYADHAERTTLYASDSDLPVHLSSKIHDAPRAGYYLPYTVAPGVDTVAVPDFDIDLLGHSYFAQAEALLHDIYDLMRHNQAPAQRQRIAAALDGSATFWKLRR
ncbi:MAG: alpha/beta hydrolase [Blastocatellia bacterium]